MGEGFCSKYAQKMYESVSEKKIFISIVSFSIISNERYIQSTSDLPCMVKLFPSLCFHEFYSPGWEFDRKEISLDKNWLF